MLRDRGRPGSTWLLLVLLLLPLAVGVPTAAAASGEAERPAVQADDTIDVTRELRLTPSTPGSVEVEFRYAPPDRVTGLAVTIPADASLTGRTGFERTGPRSFAWDGATADPKLRFSVPANETGAARGTLARDGRYTFVDPGPWALIRLPSVSTEWRWTGGGKVTLDRRTSTEGPGAVGTSLAFLGPHRTVTREVDGGTLRLIIPERADLAESPDAILGSVADASERIRFGATDETVTMVAAPSDSVTWAVGGLQIGTSDFWVRDGEQLDTANNAWLHEFVHTQQEYETAESSRWTIEGTATYYAALLALEQERITFEEFRRRLGVGTRDPDGSAVLADLDTWEPSVPYTKGALVAGELDRQTRTATGDRTLDVVMRRLNAKTDPVTNGDVLAAVRDIAGSDAGALANRYTTTEAVPDAWDRSAHQEAYESPIARMAYATGSVAIAGRYRNASAEAESIRLASGETLRAGVAVTNEGTASGQYGTRLSVNGTVVDSRKGTLGAGESTGVTLAHQFTDVGVYRVTIGGTTRTVRVGPPATPRVTALNATPADGAGSTLTVTVRVTNSEAIPADGRLRLDRNETTIAERRVVLAPGSTTRLQFEDVTAPPGTTLAVGNRTATVPRSTAVAGGRDGDTGRSGPTETRGSGPGLGAVAALFAVVVATLLTTRLR